MKKTISLSDKVLAYIVSEANYNLRKTTLLGIALGYTAIYAKINSKAFLSISRKLSKSGRVQYDLSSFHDVQQSLTKLGISLSERKAKENNMIESIVSSLTKKEKSLFNSFNYLYFSKASILTEFLDNNIHIVSSKSKEMKSRFSISQLAAKEKEVFFEGTFTIQDNANFVLTISEVKETTKKSTTKSTSKKTEPSKKSSKHTKTTSTSDEKSNIIEYYGEVWKIVLEDGIEEFTSLYFAKPEDICNEFSEKTDFKSIINVFFATKVMEMNLMLSENFKSALKILHDSYVSTVLKCNKAFSEDIQSLYNKLIVEQAECILSIHPDTIICLPFYLGTKDGSMVVQYIEFTRDEIILSEVITSVSEGKREHAIDFVTVSLPSFADLNIAKTIADMNEVCEKFTSYSTAVLFLGELISLKNNK